MGMRRVYGEKAIEALKYGAVVIFDRIPLDNRNPRYFKYDDGQMYYSEDFGNSWEEAWIKLGDLKKEELIVIGEER